MIIIDFENLEADTVKETEINEQANHWKTNSTAEN